MVVVVGGRRQPRAGITHKIGIKAGLSVALAPPGRRNWNWNWEKLRESLPRSEQLGGGGEKRGGGASEVPKREPPRSAPPWLAPRASPEAPPPQLSLPLAGWPEPARLPGGNPGLRSRSPAACQARR